MVSFVSGWNWNFCLLFCSWVPGMTCFEAFSSMFYHGSCTYYSYQISRSPLSPPHVLCRCCGTQINSQWDRSVCLECAEEETQCCCSNTAAEAMAKDDLGLEKCPNPHSIGSILNPFKRLGMALT